MNKTAGLYASSTSAAPLTSPTTADASPHHTHHAPISVGCAVLTMSDTRSEATDTSGGYLREAIRAAGHQLCAYHLVPDETQRIEKALEAFWADPRVEVILCNGGTGITRRDVSFRYLSTQIEQPLPGFGELFRMLSYPQIGAAALLSRAIGGIARGRALFSLPGSEAAVRLGWEQLICPVLGHLVQELRR